MIKMLHTLDTLAVVQICSAGRHLKRASLVQGEVTIVVEGTAAAVRAQPSQTQVEMQLRALISDGMAPSQAAKAAALRLGVPRSAVYEAAVRIGAERQ